MSSDENDTSRVEGVDKKSLPFHGAERGPAAPSNPPPFNSKPNYSQKRKTW